MQLLADIIKKMYELNLITKNDLYNLGYDKYMIENVLSNIEYDSNALSKDLEKANKKFKGDKTKIINSLLRKGYSYEEINTSLK